MIKLIIFDLWQTLAYRDVNYHITAEILKLFNPHISKKKIIKVFENSIQTKKWKSEYKASENLCKDLNINSDKETIKLIMGLRDYADSKTKLYPHVVPMLKKLRKKRYKIGLLSNSSIFDVKYMEKSTHLLKYIDYPLFSFNTGKIKPDSTLFKKLLDIAKCKPKEAIMIGDKKKDDILPAKYIGMNTILYKNPQQLKKELAFFGIFLK